MRVASSIARLAVTSYLVIGTSGGIGQLDGLDPATEDPRFPDTVADVVVTGD